MGTWILLLICILALHVPVVSAARESTIRTRLDFRFPGAFDRLSEMSRNNWVPSANGIVPRRPVNGIMPLEIQDLPASNLPDRPILVLTVRSEIATRLELVLEWKMDRFMDAADSGALRVITHRLLPGRMQDLYLDLRDCPYAAWTGIDRLSVGITPVTGTLFPEITGLEFRPAGIRTVSMERWQRIVSMDPAYNQIRLNVFLALACLVIVPVSAVLALRGPPNFRVRLEGAVAVTIMAAWAWTAVMGVPAMVSQSMADFRSADSGLFDPSQHHTATEHFRNMVASLVPDTATVGILRTPATDPSEEHIAKYRLAPRRVVWGPDADFVIVHSPVFLSSDLLNLADNQGFHLVYAVSPYLALFARHPWSPPPLPGQTVPLTGEHLHASVNPEAAGFAVDGDMGTRWDTGRVMLPGDYLEIRLDRPEILGGIRLHHAPSFQDHPRGLKVSLSTDGNAWTGTHTLIQEYPRRNYTDMVFSGSRARIIRLEQTGSTAFNFWSVHELELTVVKESP